jgi:peptidylprolyl isomerase
MMGRAGRVTRLALRGVLAAAKAATATPVSAGDAAVNARAGAITLRADEVRAYVETLDPRDQAAVARDPGALSQAVRALLASRAVLKQALAQKVEQQPAVAAQLQRLRDDALVEIFLQSVTKPPEGYPNDGELEAAYEANKTAFLVPRQFLIAQIFVASPKTADKTAADKARRKIDEIQKKLKQKGADFAAIAAAESEEPDTGKRRGEAAWLLEGQIVPEIRPLVNSLPKDAIGEPTLLDDGWHIVKLVDTKAAYTAPLGEVRAQVTQRLRAERALANRRVYLAKLLEQSPPAINELALTTLLSKPDK